MKKKINGDYLPLQILKTTTALRPRAWEQMKDFHDHNGQDGLSHWPEWCYAPIAAAIAVATEGAPITPQNREYFLNSIKLAQQIAPLAPWRLSKEVFLVDEISRCFYLNKTEIWIFPQRSCYSCHTLAFTWSFIT